MVNVNLSTKSKILKILRAEEKPVKGELLAAECGISRVAVWKAVQALEQAGYGIGSSRSGYELTKDLEDSLYPWEFEKDEANHYHFAKTESTMIQAKNAVEDCADGEMKIITADMQNTNGQPQKEALHLQLLQGNTFPSWKATVLSWQPRLPLQKHLKITAEKKSTCAGPMTYGRKMGRLAEFLTIYAPQVQLQTG